MNKNEILKILKETSEKLAEIGYVNTFIDEDDVSLNVKIRRGRPEFFLYDRRTGRQEYLALTEDERIRGLVRSYYEKRLRAAAYKEKKQIDRCIGILGKEGDVDEVYGRLPKAIREFAEPHELTDDGYAESWKKETIDLPKRPVKTSYTTIKGEKVRSKSEVIIADRLYAAGVPYKYEWPYTLDDGYTTIHPDFLALNKHTRKEVLWEHFGKLDDADYCDRMQQRLEGYSKYGYFPGKRLILTYESSKHPLNTEYVDRLIKEFLL